MSVTETHSIPNIAGAWLGSAKTLLDETFGVKFEFWLPHDPWCLLNDGFEIVEADPAEFLPQAVGEQALREVYDRGEPMVVDISMGQQFVLVPVRQRSATEMIAAAVVPSHEADLVLRLAQRFVREFDLRQEMVKVRTENEHFIRQVTQDFEELTFLRNVTEQMDIATVASDIVQVAQVVLPLLKQSTLAECILMILEPIDNQDVPKIAAHVGDLPIDNEACLRLLSHFRVDARIKPVVRNRRFASETSEAMEGLRSFVLVPISKSTDLFGWLMAANRVAGAGQQDLTNWAIHDDEFGTSEAALINSAASMLATHATNLELFREKEKLLTNVVRSLVSAIEAKDNYTSGHSERVALFASRLGKELGYDAEARERLYMTGLLHDVGKIAIPDATLGKPDRLTDEEFNTIKRHPDEGWAILYELQQLSYVLPGLLFHHERYDGKGYPDGLAGEQIPLDGRILAVADTYDAMTSNRPYRHGMLQAKAEAILLDGAGKQWDKKVVDAFFRVKDDIIRIRESYREHQRRQRVTGSTMCQT